MVFIFKKLDLMHLMHFDDALLTNIFLSDGTIVYIFAIYMI